MAVDLPTLVAENIGALIALLGVVVGAGLVGLRELILGRRAQKLRIWDKLIDRRIDAHDRIIELSKKMRTTFALGGLCEDGEVRRAPVLLETREEFQQYMYEFAKTVGVSSTWLSTDAHREVNLVQDYFVNLNMLLPEDACEELCREVGVVLLHDFIHLSRSLEKSAYKFFERDVWKLKLGNLGHWHKYPKRQTFDRLDRTCLFTKKAILEDIVANFSK